ncbi:hypothetical protein [Chryseobacterium suipulveris]|nr:hypothetical protein [Chryseobacterium suipulveris]
MAKKAAGKKNKFWVEKRFLFLCVIFFNSIAYNGLGIAEGGDF